MTQWWDVSPKDAVALQHKLRTEVSIEPLGKELHTIAGADVSLNLYAKEIFAGIIVLSYPDLTPLTYSVLRSETDFPYISGLLSFREVPALMECFERLTVKPDVVMLDGQGIAHPRHLGVASHFGVLAHVPTIGCAKSRLYGTYTTPEEPGECSDILDPKTGEVIGVAYKSKARSNPLIISPGHLINVREACEITKSCVRTYRLPEPTRLAHELVNAFRKGEDLSPFGRQS